MKKWLWYAFVITAVALLSGRSASRDDVGKLQPVQVVRVSSFEGWVRIETDTGDMGEGDTLKKAFDNMKQTASAEIFLDTADYLIVDETCRELLPTLADYLRPSCAVCMEKGRPDMELVGQFLEFHKPELTLMHYKAEEKEIPILKTEEGRMKLVS